LYQDTTRKLIVFSLSIYLVGQYLSTINKGKI
jgi:hypothetical protein